MASILNKVPLLLIAVCGLFQRVSGIDLLAVHSYYEKDKLATFSLEGCSVCGGADTSKCTTPLATNWYVSGKCVGERLFSEDGVTFEYQWTRIDIDSSTEEACVRTVFSDPNCTSTVDTQPCEDLFGCESGYAYEVLRDVCIEVDSNTEAKAPFSIPFLEQTDFTSKELCLTNAIEGEFLTLFFPSVGCYPSILVTGDDAVAEIGAFSVECQGSSVELKSFTDIRCSSDSEITSQSAIYQPECFETLIGRSFRTTKGCGAVAEGTRVLYCKPESIGEPNFLLESTSDGNILSWFSPILVMSLGYTVMVQ